MKLGLFYLPIYLRDVHGREADYYERILEQAELADRKGLDTVWCAEHHFNPYGGVFPSVPVMLATLAQRTTRIRIGSSSVCLPLHKPLELAEQLAMVDQLSRGRLSVGFARAFMAKEYAAHNVDMGESRARFDEAAEIVIGLWEQEHFSYTGKFWQLEDVTILPRPYQRPRPPVYISCVQTRESFENAGRNGHHCMTVPYLGTNEELRERIGYYHSGLRERGIDPAEREVLANFHFYAHEDEATAREDAREPLLRYMSEFADAVAVDAYSKDYKGYEGLSKMLREITYEYMYPERCLVGTPEKIIGQLRALATLGVTEVGLTVDFGGLPHAKIMRSLELLATQIAPAVRAKEVSHAGR